MEIQKRNPMVLFITVLTLLLAVMGYLYYEYYTQNQKINMLLEERNYFLLENSSTTNTLEQERELASSTIADLEERLALTLEELEDVERDLKREEDRNEEFEDQLRDLSGAVGILDKLSKTDEELLQKYSRTYFLNDDFVP